ncbi:BlaI/MecI/CopY family transcriptional regulator [Clostridium sporogenes]|uniref:BlaI/MecI/CopY family transcriptional regulator n=1 Tax=Clostridium sporogenes TaxID=1509 RepID=UPI0013D23131|nr:BlaI/MecI/CopY family transcriptional regulator [Clostridium sporogenes]NFG95628.1 BlaI/MecI/CopY family transcriptional regulator [Clostridium sporogenes]NFH32729.1 BlaI/MecI/CopY family transcriptional regulator [Clostridium sporogenes]NFL18883.1 BlaI/MecI/CopY family transcriptional regulator [Clostridium sporogenes]NFN71885.1 BlaI/MecI/CopY family transcriptional regulator [Clostridium sporogenes]NFV21265.1 BlaI/MecI/CopY family transcriptional regulator [Clostridium sporogenes]
MKDMPKISAAEWEVMKLLWKESPLTSEKIINSLTEKMDWSTQTVKTFITRLLKKEAIGFEKIGRAYNYYPLISEDECIKAENKSFLQKVYDGAVGILFTRFLEEETLSEEEIEELEQILKDKKEGK